MFFAVQAKKAKQSVIFGYEMANKHKEGKPLPKIVQLEPSDTKKIMLLKSCIFRMTTFHSIDRASVQEVRTMIEGNHIFM